jgi:hypothetical protein
MLKGCYNS